MNMIILIAALDEESGIGKNNTIPWHIPEDFKLFKEFTQGNVIIMGRKTWDSLPKKPLPNRVNIVLSRSVEEFEGAKTAGSLKEAIDIAKTEEKDIFIIGGNSLFREGLGLADQLYLSHVKGVYDADTFFPEFDMKKWQVVEEKQFERFIFRKYMKS